MGAENGAYTLGIAVSRIRERVLCADVMTGVITLHNGAQTEEGTIWYEPTPLQTGSITEAQSVFPLAKEFGDWRSMQHLLPDPIADQVLDLLTPGLTVTLLARHEE